jgi:hypothetical protein
MRTKHKINEQFFSSIDTPEQAYWLGFIVADGGVYKNHLRVSLEETDGPHVYKLRAALDAPTVPVFRREFKNAWNTRPQLCFDVTRASLVSDLKKLGVVPNKTVHGWIPEIKTPLQPHFWRGVFDGDGHISKLSDGLWGIGLAGSLDTMTKFTEFIKDRTGHTMSIHPISRRGNLPPVCFRVISQGTAKPRAIVASMYADSICPAELCLVRKKAKADELLYGN